MISYANILKHWKYAVCVFFGAKVEKNLLKYLIRSHNISSRKIKMFITRLNRS